DLTGGDPLRLARPVVVVAQHPIDEATEGVASNGRAFAADDVSLADQTDQPVTDVDDGHGPDVVIEQLGGDLLDRRGRLDSHRRRGHDVGHARWYVSCRER